MCLGLHRGSCGSEVLLEWSQVTHPASLGVVKWMVIVLVARDGEWSEVYGSATGQGTGWEVPKEEQEHMRQCFGGKIWLVLLFLQTVTSDLHMHTCTHTEL